MAFDNLQFMSVRDRAGVYHHDKLFGLSGAPTAPNSGREFGLVIAEAAGLDGDGALARDGQRLVDAFESDFVKALDFIACGFSELLSHFERGATDFDFAIACGGHCMNSPVSKRTRRRLAGAVDPGAHDHRFI